MQPRRRPGLLASRPRNGELPRRASTSFHATHCKQPIVHIHSRRRRDCHSNLAAGQASFFPSTLSADQSKTKHHQQSPSSLRFLPRLKRHHTRPAHNPSTGKTSHGPQRHRVARRGAPSLLAGPHGEYTLSFSFPPCGGNEFLPLTYAPPPLPIPNRAARS